MKPKWLADQVVTCEAYWPAFREVDFLRALRSYTDRHRRRGA